MGERLHSVHPRRLRYAHKPYHDGRWIGSIDDGPVLEVGQIGSYSIRQIVLAPGLHVVDDVHEAPAQIGQGVFDPRRDFLKIMPD